MILATIVSHLTLKLNEQLLFFLIRGHRLAHTMRNRIVRKTQIYFLHFIQSEFRPV